MTVRDLLPAIYTAVNQGVGGQGETGSTAAPGLTELTEAANHGERAA